jgi:hypothetical protein
MVLCRGLKKALINLDLTAKHYFALSLKFINDNLAWMQEVKHHSFPVNTAKTEGCSYRRPGHKMLIKMALFIFT